MPLKGKGNIGKSLKSKSNVKKPLSGAGSLSQSLSGAGATNEALQGQAIKIGRPLRASFLYKAQAGDTFNIRIRNRFGTVHVYWGDGAIEELKPSTLSIQGFNHTYVKAGEYPVQLYYDSSEIFVLEVLNDKNFYAHTSSFPTQLSVLRSRSTNTYGNIKYFPDVGFSYRIEQELNVFGDIKGWQNRTAQWFYGNGTSISGSPLNLPKNNQLDNNIVRRFGNTELEGDLAIIPQECGVNIFWLNNIKSASYSGGAYQNDVSGSWIRMDNNNLSSSEVDQALIDLSNSGSTGGDFEIHGTNAPRTANSDTAYNDLINKGWSVSVN